jgi:hypothetical protein
MQKKPFTSLVKGFTISENQGGHGIFTAAYSLNLK